ncbi:MAG TPA: LemA family protein, partial [Rhodocyclaceae bacterium]
LGLLELVEALGICQQLGRRLDAADPGPRFRDLQAQLEGTENRITVARNRYIKAVEAYNVSLRTFPNNLTAMAFGYQVKPNFSVNNEQAISTAPKVDFGGAK